MVQPPFMTILTRNQMQEADRATIEDIGIPSLVLMEVAGRAVADGVAELEDARPVLAVAGTGNNGGDATVAARHLKERGFQVSLVVLGKKERLTPDAKTQLQIADRSGLAPEFVDEDEGRVRALLEYRPTVIDGIFGTGLVRPVEGFRAGVIDQINRAAHRVVAIDLPSGIDADTGAVLGTAIQADRTITFQFSKLGHWLFPGRAHAGELCVVDIGIPEALIKNRAPFVDLITDQEIEEAWPTRGLDTHKGTYGHLLVVAGSPDRPGAALLCGRAGLRSGAGLVTVASDEATMARVAGTLDELMGQSIEWTVGAAEAALSTKTALAIGPSLTPDPNWLRKVLMEAQVPAVVDAGALTALCGPTGLSARQAGLPGGAQPAGAPGPTGLSARQAGLPGGAQPAGAPGPTGLSARQAGLPGGAQPAGAPGPTGLSARQAGLPGGAQPAGAPGSTGLSARQAGLPGGVQPADLDFLRARTYPTILTPHPGEMSRLMGIDSASVQGDRLAAIRQVARASGAVVVLKGASTLVASQGGARVGVVPAGNPGMATGGCGDVLTGIVGGLLAQGVEPELAARAGALAHARAGDRARGTRGAPGLVASDLLLELPGVIR